jgi:hypothetical protein
MRTDIYCIFLSGGQRRWELGNRSHGPKIGMQEVAEFGIQYLPEELFLYVASRVFLPVRTVLQFVPSDVILSMSLVCTEWLALVDTHCSFALHHRLSLPTAVVLGKASFSSMCSDIATDRRQSRTTFSHGQFLQTHMRWSKHTSGVSFDDDPPGKGFLATCQIGYHSNVTPAVPISPKVQVRPPTLNFNFNLIPEKLQSTSPYPSRQMFFVRLSVFIFFFLPQVFFATNSKLRGCQLPIGSSRPNFLFSASPRV